MFSELEGACSVNWRGHVCSQNGGALFKLEYHFPMCGNQQMQAHLLSRGFRVQQHRVRETQRRVDPEGTLLRRLNGIFRREYSVPAPQSLYHIDGNHKLIRYVTFYSALMN